MAQLIYEFSNAGLGLLDYFSYFFSRLQEYSVTIPGTPISEPTSVGLFSLLAGIGLTSYLLYTILAKWVVPG